MLTITAPAVPDIRRARARALCVAGGALAAAVAWTVEVPLLGIDLNFRYGTSQTQIVAVGQVTGASLAAVLLGWLLLAVLEQRTPHARTLWTSLALAGLAASVALPLTVATTAATTASAVVGLVVMHLTIGAAVIPVMARTARARRQRTRKPAG
jgi:MFS family permease